MAFSGGAVSAESGGNSNRRTTSMGSKSKRSFARPSTLWPPRARRKPRARPEPRYDPGHVKFSAVHEAGHAVVAFVLGIPLGTVSAERQRLGDGSFVAGYARIEMLESDDLLERGLGWCPTLIGRLGS